jgi:toxin ParE1/3/4
VARPILSPAARSDLEQILTYLDRHSPHAADRFAVEVDRIIDRLVKLPRMGRDRSDLRPGLRSVVISNYILFYRIAKKRVEIVRILHGARDIDSIFESNDNE